MIADFENTRAANAARMENIMNDAGERNETLNAQEVEEYDRLAVDVKSIDDHLVRLRNMQASTIASVQPVAGDTSAVASTVRGGRAVVAAQPKKPADAGRRFANVVQCFVAGRGNWFAAAQFAEAIFPDRPEVALACKAAVAPLDTTTSHAASELTPYQNLASEFIDFLYPLTIIGRLAGFRRIPFNVRIPVQTGGSTSHWVGEGKAKPLTGVTFDSITLRWAKVAGIIPFTEELSRFSNPAIEDIVRTDLANGMAKFLDQQFIDPAVTAVTNVSPASVTNGATHHASVGIDIPSARLDIQRALMEFSTNLIPLTGSVWVTTGEVAIALGMLQNPLGQPAFPGLDASGGTVFGLPMITSESVPSGLLVLLKPSEILLADEGGVQIDVSREASLIMADNPTSGATTAVSLWQNNLVAVKAERFINWQRRRDKAVFYLTGANYGGTVTL
jgi:HK97 family phage major capsid protein